MVKLETLTLFQKKFKFTLNPTLCAEKGKVRLLVRVRLK